MEKKTLDRYRSDWKLIDLKAKWDIDEVELINEDDDFSFGDYHSDY